MSFREAELPRQRKWCERNQQRGGYRTGSERYVHDAGLHYLV